MFRNYFQILEDTRLGLRIQPWKKAKNRRVIEIEKFYLFDSGITNYLTRRAPAAGTLEFGKSFEQFILMELKAYQAYRNPELDIRYWRTSSGFEVDFIPGDMDVAVEVKGSNRIHSGHIKGMRALRKEHSIGRGLIVSIETRPRKTDDSVEILPGQDFLEELWPGRLGV